MIKHFFKSLQLFFRPALLTNFIESYQVKDLRGESFNFATLKDPIPEQTCGVITLLFDSEPKQVFEANIDFYDKHIIKMPDGVTRTGPILYFCSQQWQGGGRNWTGGAAGLNGQGGQASANGVGG